MVASKAVYEAVVGKARDAAAEIQPTADWVIKALEETYCSDLRYLIDPVIGLPGTNLCPTVKLAIAEFQRLMDEYLPKLVQALDYLDAVPPYMLAAGSQWKDIQQRATEVSNSALSLSQSEEMGWWEGDAGKAYSTGVGDQSGAAAAISSTAGTISSACETFFDWNLGCAIAIAAGLATFLLALPPAIPSAGTSLVPAAAGLGVAVLGAVLDAAFGIVQPTLQLEGAVPIQNMPGGRVPTGGGWPSATQGSQNP
jgi:hypothetical protein